jgi:tetratricopeptide (TPR) repeat protein
MLRKLLLVFVLGIASAPSLFSQHHHHETEKVPPRQAELLDGLGNHVHPIATTSAPAQQFFNQGMALIFGFNHDEAARLFARAAELDPASPMPHWGIALALGPNYNLPAMPEREEKAWKAIERAAWLSKNAPANERAYVEALVKRYSRDPAEDRKKLAVTYKDAMKHVMTTYPDDLDAATLYAEALMNLRPWALWNPDGTPAEDTLEILQVLETVLRRDPSHPGANHYYIHAVEASKNPERALPSAMRLGSLMPGAGHLVHMPSHIFLRLGDFETSATVNETASEVDQRYIERTAGSKAFYSLMYYSHNLHFVSYVRMMQGKFDESIDYARRLRKNVDGAVDGMPMLGSYAAFEWLILTRFGKWNDMLAQSEPKEKDPFVNAMYRYSRTLAFVGLGRLREADAERRLMSEIAGRISEKDTLMNNSSRSVAEIGIVELEAKIARARKDMIAEIESLKQAVALQDKLNYMEPPEWHYPLREALGGAYLRQGQAAEAEAVFRKDLEVNPRNGRSLFGLIESLKLQGKTVGAEWVQMEFAEAWKYAPITLEISEL